MLLRFFVISLPLMEVASSSGVGQINRMATSTGEGTSMVLNGIAFEACIFAYTREEKCLECLCNFIS